ncbi:MAG: hypothetical protein CMF61_03760 [Magnetococcales bacterium]|nr:hypothetical protein [Magnetococcales bacterium]|tara:strand:- start:180 stop:1223 length:1044 start_codon:yes stop_codon:yes gene_type:complete
MIKMKKTLLMATGALLAAGFASSDAKAVDVELYGQVNKTLISADNGSTTEVAVRDNDKSSTRVGLKGEQALDNGLTASVLVEYELNGDNTRDKDLFATTAGGSSTLTERHARVGLSGMFGTVLLGQTSDATDGAAEQDMAGVNDLLGSDIRRFGGASSFVGAGNPTVSTVFKTFDSVRSDVIAYHTPVIAGVQGRISTAEGGNVDAAAFYKGKYDAFAVKAAIGYEMKNDGVDATLEDEVYGSISVKHDSSLAATYAYATEGRDSGTEAEMHYFKVGYTFDALEVAADYATADATTGHEGKAYGIGAQYNLGHGVSVAGAYRQLEAENSTASADDIDLIMANVRVKF